MLDSLKHVYLSPGDILFLGPWKQSAISFQFLFLSQGRLIKHVASSLLRYIPPGTLIAEKAQNGPSIGFRVASMLVFAGDEDTLEKTSAMFSMSLGFD